MFSYLFLLQDCSACGGLHERNTVSFPRDFLIYRPEVGTRRVTFLEVYVDCVHYLGGNIVGN